MIDYKYKPSYLPQISAPYIEVVDYLSKNNVGYSISYEDPNDLNPLQGIVSSNKVENITLDDKENPIWISKSNDILDGHHRWYKSKLVGNKIFCIKIDKEYMDAIRILNKIQDLFDYKNTININSNSFNNDEFSKIGNIGLDAIAHPMSDIICYRGDDIVENSPIGNFFMLKPINTFKKYNISFDNILDLTKLFENIGYKSEIVALSDIWFPFYDFSKYTNQNENIKMRCAAIVSAAKKMNYDGIKYKNFIQTF